MTGIGQFYNSAQAQQYAQNSNECNANAAQGQTFGQNQAQLRGRQCRPAAAVRPNLSSGQFANAAQQQLFNNASRPPVHERRPRAEVRPNQAQLEAAMQPRTRSSPKIGRCRVRNNALQQQYQNQNTATAGNNCACRSAPQRPGRRSFNLQNQERAQYLNELYAQRNQPGQRDFGAPVRRPGRQPELRADRRGASPDGRLRRSRQPKLPESAQYMQQNKRQLAKPASAACSVRSGNSPRSPTSGRKGRRESRPTQGPWPLRVSL